MPFTPEEFLGVFRRYNEAMWPAPIVLPLTAIACYMLLREIDQAARRAVLLILAFLWAWTGVFYHLAFFTAINPAARWFALLFLVEATILARAGFGGVRVHPVRLDAARVVGATLIVYALVAYPLIGYALGHRYPSTPTFGLPCPTTIFTLGVLAWMRPDASWTLFVIPIAWSAIATSAALQLGMIEDLGLPVAAAAVIALLVSSRLARSRATTGSSHPALAPR